MKQRDARRLISSRVFVVIKETGRSAYIPRLSRESGEKLQHGIYGDISADCRVTNPSALRSLRRGR